jgi:hypothetical protein
MSSRSERFKKLYPNRLKKAAWSIRSIGKLSNRTNYVYEDEEVDKILSTLMFELKAAISKFGKGTVEDRFKRYIQIDKKHLKVIGETDPELYDYIMQIMEKPQGNLLKELLQEPDKDKKETSTSTSVPEEKLLTKKEFDEKFGEYADLTLTIKNTEDMLTHFSISASHQQRELSEQLKELQSRLNAQAQGKY